MSITPLSNTATPDPNTPTSPDQWDTKIKLAHLSVVMSFLGLISCMAGSLLLKETTSANNPVLMWALPLLPLLLITPGIIKRDLRTHLVLGFLLLFYFSASVSNMFTPTHHWLDMLEIVLQVDLFTAAMLYILWRNKKIRALRSATSITS